MLEIWRADGSNTGTSPELARSVDAEGWDGQTRTPSRIGQAQHQTASVAAAGQRRHRLFPRDRSRLVIADQCGAAAGVGVGVGVG